MSNFIFDRENFRSRPWPRSNLSVTFKAKSTNSMFAFRFMAIRPFVAAL